MIITCGMLLTGYTKSVQAAYVMVNTPVTYKFVEHGLQENATLCYIIIRTS